MTIVELIDAHDGFNIIISKITETNKRRLLWIIGFLTFFLSAVLDNITTTIIMVSLIRKLLNKGEDRLYFVALIIIAANAGGAWSPIGDITTTMLWIGGQITAINIIQRLFLPSLICLIVPLSIITFLISGNIKRNIGHSSSVKVVSQRQQLIVLIAGLLILVMVPVFKTVTHLPPFMGVLLGLGLLWFITILLHKSKDTIFGISGTQKY
jgi:Na+/H+ antiporter NhaD/arsenite permease-like protein